MPRKKGRKKRGRRKSNQSLKDQDITARCPIRLLYTESFSGSFSTTTVLEFNMTLANMGDRAVNLSQIYMYWRATLAHFRQVVETGSPSAGLVNPPGGYLHSVAWVPVSTTDYKTATLLNAVEFPEFQLQSGTNACDLRVKQIGMRTLSPWLASSTTPDAILQACGSFTVTLISAPVADAVVLAAVRGYAEFMLQFRATNPTQTKQIDVRLKYILPTRRTEYYPDKTFKVLYDYSGETYSQFVERRSKYAFLNNYIEEGKDRKSSNDFISIPEKKSQG